ncbi:hypothetical protein N7462_010116 [Penicillium macrosclerotiorum]|uniref:uncharacterized protein n=1 Tax=Penicillium macrosclerotiorum TaxID=303699 RepID=UPI0025492C5C|nr:uncharacterized protein N7462_010116 [Penicillium macrosclerotiorum]KAJ5669046.1 hypothetical protein N7462_010116 [Penicillium macrosclerotiorum]
MMLDSINDEGLFFEHDGHWYYSNSSDPIQVPRPGNEHEMEQIFWDNFVKINASIQESLPGSYNVTSMVYPRHLNASALEMFTKMASRVPGIQIPKKQLMDSYGGVFRAYDFPVSDAGGLIFFYDLNEEFVDIAFGTIAKYRTFPDVSERQLFMRILSRHYLAVRMGMTEQERDERYDEFRENQAEMLEGVAFLKDMSTLKGIIITGEGPEWAMKRLQNSITLAAPDYANKIQGFIDPAFAGAVGAAKWAKYQLEHADTFFDDAGGNHEEL